LVCDEHALLALWMDTPRHLAPVQASQRLPEGHALLTVACQQLDEYFAKTRTRFDLPLKPQGTLFQQSVWQALLQIPYGETRSYGAQAKALGDEKAVRAVAAANGQNPIGIVIPCHRVIAANGALTGYAGGLDRKAWLLRHEVPGLF
jgi:methylated-DNA-[protein]-cysteine S-methyltransferase